MTSITYIKDSPIDAIIDTSHYAARSHNPSKAEKTTLVALKAFLTEQAFLTRPSNTVFPFPTQLDCLHLGYSCNILETIFSYFDFLEQVRIFNDLPRIPDPQPPPKLP